MSHKLVSLIKDNPRLSAKHKRVLEAYAAHANNDGTNIFAGKAKIGKKASISRSTIYHHTPDLIRAEILVQATSHTCKSDACNKGGTHYWGVQGKYTVVYNINLPALENAQTYLLLDRLKVPLPKQLNLFVQNVQKVDVAKLDTTRSLEPTPVSLSEKDSSVLTDGVSLLASQLVQTPSASIVDQKQDKQPHPVVSQQDKPDLDPEIKELSYQLGCSQAIPALLGLPYFASPVHDEAVDTMAEVLWYRDRSIHWLETMLVWIKKHPFWSKRVHNGDRGVAQLAKHVANEELCQQFDAHIILKQGEGMLGNNSGYRLGRFKQLAQAASAGGFQPEEAE